MRVALVLAAIAATVVGCGDDRPPPPPAAPAAGPVVVEERPASEALRDLDTVTLFDLDSARWSPLREDELDAFLDRAAAVAAWIEAHRAEWNVAHDIQRDAAGAGAPENGVRSFLRHRAGLAVWDEVGIEFAVFATVRMILLGHEMIRVRGGLAASLRSMEIDIDGLTLALEGDREPDVRARLEEQKAALELAMGYLEEHGAESLARFEARSEEIGRALDALDRAEGR